MEYIEENVPHPLLFFISLSHRRVDNSVNTLVPSDQLLPAALRVAKEITSNSPDAVQSTKHGLLLSQQLNYHKVFMTHAQSDLSTRVYKGENIKVS